MEKKEICSASNIKLDEGNYKKYRAINKNYYNEKKRKNKNNKALIQNQQAKNNQVKINKNN